MPTPSIDLLIKVLNLRQSARDTVSNKVIVESGIFELNESFLITTLRSVCFLIIRVICKSLTLSTKNFMLSKYLLYQRKDHWFIDLVVNCQKD